MTEKTIEYVQSRHHGDDKTVGMESKLTKDTVEGPLGQQKKPEPEGGAKDLSHLQRKKVQEGSTHSEESVRLDVSEQQLTD